jgi:hypothetical protein
MSKRRKPTGPVSSEGDISHLTPAERRAYFEEMRNPGGAEGKVDVWEGAHPRDLQWRGVLRNAHGVIVVPEHVRKHPILAEQWLELVYLLENEFDLDDPGLRSTRTERVARELGLFPYTPTTDWKVIDAAILAVDKFQVVDIAICPQCSFPAQIHPFDRRRVTDAKRYEDRKLYLRVLCDGDRVKAVAQEKKAQPQDEALPAGYIEVR